MKENKIDINKIHIPRWNELPNIDLYSEQVVSFINSTLSPIVSLYGDLEENKTDLLLTKSMINNYVKNNLIKPPQKKLYSKIQLAKLFVICILKQSYCMQEIDSLTKLTLEGSSIIEAYDDFCLLFESCMSNVFSKSININNKSNSNNIFLKESAIYTCCLKIYVQTYLNDKE